MPTGHPITPFLAPQWAITTGQIGRWLIIAAFAAFVASILGWIFGTQNPKVQAVAKWAFPLGALCLFGSIVCLGRLFAGDQFEFNYVFEHSDVPIETRFKVAGIWAGQQGSFLLWACTSALFGVLAARLAGTYRRWFTVCYSVFLATLCGILTYETPYNVFLIDHKVINPGHGAGLAPSLLNYWVTIHPPTIFMGFGSLTVAAAYAFSAMLTGDLTEWVRRLRPWAILSTAILGLGLCMGGFWAYETLGWGGFWMWDPVENVSFVPWILSAGLLHSIIVQTTRKKWFGPTVLMGGMPFLLFSYGTFLTRSGFLNEASVHSFATMNRVALWILAGFVVVATGTFLTLYGVRGRKLARAQEPTGAVEKDINRQSMYTSGVILLSGMAAATAIGMSVPFFLGITGHNSKVVEEPLYHQVIVWFFLPIMFLIGLAPFVTWRGLSLSDLWKRIGNVAAVTVFVTGVALMAVKLTNAADGEPITFPGGFKVSQIGWVMILTSVCIFAAVSNVWRMVETFRKSPMGTGGFVAHLGVAILLAGLIVSRGFEHKEETFVRDGSPGKAMGMTVTYQGMSHGEEGGLFNPNNKLLLEVSDGKTSFTAEPGLYFILKDDGSDPSPMVWPYIQHGLASDFYITLHPPVMDLWPDDVMFDPGQTQDPGGRGVEVTYKDFKMVGPGGPGTEFVADAIVRVKDTNGNWTSHEVNPSVTVSQQGLIPNIVPVDDSFAISLKRIDAGSKAAAFQVHFSPPLFPVDLIFKPMVGLVWLGCGIMTLGGFMAAFSRRTPPNKPKVRPAPKLDVEEDVESEVKEPVAL